MLYPSCTDLINIVNNDVEPGEQPVIKSRYSIVLAAAKRARQIISGDDAMVPGPERKPLSMAIEEIYVGKVKIVSEDDSKEDEIELR